MAHPEIQWGNPDIVGTDAWIRLESGRWRFCPHDGQRRALDSRARFVLVLAGWQSGKTVIGPRWLLEEIVKCGPGDYLVASPTFALMDVKVVPEYWRLFQSRLRLGTMRESPRPRFTFSEQGRQYLASINPAAWSDTSTETIIRFGHAKDPDSLESATYKAAHLDEPGQKAFKRASFETIESRVAVHQGRVLMTSRPYYIGWLKAEIYDRWKAGDPDYEVINFSSVDNPAFPREEFERQRRKLPGWKFRMKYLGQFERPAGMIYSNFSRATHCIARFPIPEEWDRFMGLDFGGVNTAAVYLAREPGPPKSCRYILYRGYLSGKMTKTQHRTAMLRGEPGIPTAVGGSWSEDQWRLDFAEAGLYVECPPIKGVEEGIERVFELLGGDRDVDEPLKIRLVIFDDLEEIIDQLESYSRVLGPDEEPTDKIENKEIYHYLDGLRYIAAEILDPYELPTVGLLVATWG